MSFCVGASGTIVMGYEISLFWRLTLFPIPYPRPWHIPTSPHPDREIGSCRDFTLTFVGIWWLSFHKTRQNLGAICGLLRQQGMIMFKLLSWGFAAQRYLVVSKMSPTKNQHSLRGSSCNHHNSSLLISHSTVTPLLSVHLQKWFSAGTFRIQAQC